MGKGGERRRRWREGRREWRKMEGREEGGGEMEGWKEKESRSFMHYRSYIAQSAYFSRAIIIFHEWVSKTWFAYVNFAIMGLCHSLHKSELNYTEINETHAEALIFEDVMGNNAKFKAHKK